MSRPLLTKQLTPEEFGNYYFLKEELKEFCRREGLNVSGNKGDLEKRIIHLPNKTSSEIKLDSKLGENFKFSEDKREFFKKEIGSSFKFKVKFQKWLKANPDKTYRDAIDEYFRIQNSKEKTEIGKQFQYNQYIRDFFENNKDKTLDDAIKCWKYKKSLKGHNRYEDSDLTALTGE